MIAEARGQELSDEQLEHVSGGYSRYEEDPCSDLPVGEHCPKCVSGTYRWHIGGRLLVSESCGERF